MKPTKNKVFCKDCERTKMLFETKKKADNFIKFNHEEIETDSGFAPERSYFCIFCGGWHTTHLKGEIVQSKNEKRFESYLTEKAKKVIPISAKAAKKEKREKVFSEIESQIKEMDNEQMETFFLEQQNQTKKEIDELSNSTNDIDKEHLRELRQYFEILCSVKKQKGFVEKNDIVEKRMEQEREEWRLWFEEKGYKR